MKSLFREKKQKWQKERHQRDTPKPYQSGTKKRARWSRVKKVIRNEEKEKRPPE